MKRNVTRRSVTCGVNYKYKVSLLPGDVSSDPHIWSCRVTPFQLSKVDQLVSCVLCVCLWCRSPRYCNYILVLCFSVRCIHTQPSASIPSTASTLPCKTHPPRDFLLQHWATPTEEESHHWSSSALDHPVRRSRGIGCLMLHQLEQAALY